MQGVAPMRALLVVLAASVLAPTAARADDLLLSAGLGYGGRLMTNTRSEDGPAIALGAGWRVSTTAALGIRGVVLLDKVFDGDVLGTQPRIQFFGPTLEFAVHPQVELGLGFGAVTSNLTSTPVPDTAGGNVMVMVRPLPDYPLACTLDVTLSARGQGRVEIGAVASVGVARF